MTGSQLSARQRVRRALLRGVARVLPHHGLRNRAGDLLPSGGICRVLLLRPDHLGDLLWLTPALHGFRQRFPAARITVAVGPWSAPLLARNQDFDDLLVIDFPGFSRRPTGHPLAPYRALLTMADDLRGRDFDLAVILRDDHWWGALLAATAGIPRRFGYAHPDVAPFLTTALPLRGHEHAAIGNLVLLDAVLADADRPAMLDGQPQRDLTTILPVHFEPGGLATERARMLLAPLQPARPIVALHPSAGVPVKLWDEARLAAVGDRLVSEFNAQLVLTGAAPDRALTAGVAAHLTQPALDLTGQTAIADLVALYRQCQLVIGPDGGALHLAVAADTPTVHLFGPADPVKFGPWGDPARHRVVSAGRHCARCGDLSPSRPRGAACMMAIGVDDVLAAARPLLGERR